ncbi:MAG: hypothetical protein LH485_08755 [Sphingomonas bacterium]|nr:hypothetical protein [Sphingomonas bacterium]
MTRESGQATVWATAELAMKAAAIASITRSGLEIILAPGVFPQEANAEPQFPLKEEVNSNIEILTLGLLQLRNNRRDKPIIAVFDL